MENDYIDPEFETLFEPPQVRYGDPPLGAEGADPEMYDPGGLLRELQRALDGQPDLPDNPLVNEARFRQTYEQIYYSSPEESHAAWAWTSDPNANPLQKFAKRVLDRQVRPETREFAEKLLQLSK